MSERTARIRLNLNSGGLLSGLGQIGDTVDGLGRRMTKALDKPVREGLSAMKSSLGSLKGQIASATSMALTFGGAFTVGGSIKEALDLEQGYRNIAFAIRAGKGEAVDWQAIQKTIEATADRTSRTNGELSASFKALYDDVGDVEFATKAIETIGTVATGSGESIGTLTNLAGQLNEKFGVTASEVDDAMAAVVAMGNKGGISLTDMGEKIGMIGASAKLMGLKGKEGVSFALGMFNIADAATGSMKKATASVTQLLDTFSNTDQLKAIEKELHVSLRTKTGEAKGDAIEQVLRKSGGKREVLSKVFTGESLKLMTEFGKVYERTFEEVEGNTKQKSNAAVEAFRAAVAEAGKQTLSSADMQEEAAKRMGDPQAQMRKAMNELQTEFTRPEMLSAMRELAEVAPKVAHGMAKLVEFAVDSPWLAGGAVIGGRAALAGAGGFASEAISGSLKALGSSMGNAASSGTKAAAELGKVTEHAGAASKGIASLAKASGMESVMGKGAAAASTATALLAVGLAAYETTTQLLKARDELDREGVVRSNNTFFETNKRMAEAKTPEERAKILKEGEQKLTEGIGFWESPQAASDSIKALKKNKEELDFRDIKSGTKVFEETMTRTADSGDKTGRAFERAAAAAEKVARAFDRVAPPAGSNGPPASPSSSPGYGGWGPQ